ncbi:MAG: hypothetical protein U0136_12105 [Bdellovibrionota bacterium]
MGSFINASPKKVAGGPQVQRDGSYEGGLPGSSLQFPTPSNSADARNPGPKTFNGESLRLRTNAQVPGFMQEMLRCQYTFTDGSGSRYTTAMAAKAFMEWKTSTLSMRIINSLLSMWTTRTWTYNIKVAQGYITGFATFLGLDWYGRAFGTGTNIWFLGDRRAGSKMVKFGESGAQAPGHE